MLLLQLMVIPKPVSKSDSRAARCSASCLERPSTRMSSTHQQYGHCRRFSHALMGLDSLLLHQGLMDQPKGMATIS